MDVSLVNAILIAAVASGAAVVARYGSLAERRRERRRAQWRAIADSLVELDSELDRAWASEVQRQRESGR
ncbi:MAG TPA: hypothetical protein VK817_09625 [Trebonia sp.]|jgi:hypothetical protein|nr:hypothetical protein [Trebonia sp.]